MSTYMLFCAMEEEFRHHFRLSNMSQLADGLRDEVVASITCNEDVVFHWCMLSSTISNSDGDTLLKMLVELWTTIRGFSFASAWVVELYKQNNKENLQCSKALHKKIN